jgi:DNA-binding NarL/FixJ family response regulator
MRVVIADGHPVVRLGIKGLLLATDIQVLGETGSAEETLELVEEQKPDVLVLGLNLDGKPDGVEVCHRVKSLSIRPRPHVLVHTARNLSDDVVSCLLAEADSYLHDKCSTRELLDAIQRTARGERVWRSGDRGGAPRTRLRETRHGFLLTHREREVLALLLRHYSNERIAHELQVSQATVKSHARKVLRKLGVKDREELLRDQTTEL